MSNEPNKLKLDLSSIVSLKAELLRKKEEFLQNKQSKISKTDVYEASKTQSTWGKKRKVEVEPSTSRDENIEIEEDENTEEKLLEKSRKMLETKAKYYDEVVAGKKMTEEGDEEIFLVNFEKKVSEENFDKSNLQLKQETVEEEYNQFLKEKWEQESSENLNKGAIHYQDIRFNEIRNMGVGNYQFSRNEEERKQQMEFFKNIEKESKTRRITNEIYRLKREKNLIERLSKVKQKRLLKFGYSLEKIKKLCHEFENEGEEIDKEISDLEKLLENPEIYLESKPKVDENLEGFELLKPKINILEREWDKPKLKEKTWVKHIEKLRKERNKMFAPPENYEQKVAKKSKKKKRKNDQIKQETVKEDQNKHDFHFPFPPPPIPPPGLFFPPFPPFPPMLFSFPPPQI